MEASHHNPYGDGQGRAPIISYRAGNTNHGPKGSLHENERSHNVAKNSQNLSHHESHNIVTYEMILIVAYVLRHAESD